MNEATLRLFNAIQVRSKAPKEIFPLKRTLRNGYILDPAVYPTAKLLDTIESIIGISGEKANATFHKSWAVVRDTPMEVLVCQQILHYITTYGFEELGFYHKDTIYIPHEPLNLPAIQKDIPLIVIRGMTAQEILDKIIDLGSGIALMQETLDDIMTIVEANNYDSDFIDKIANRELKALLYDFYSLVPSDPVEFLRHLISKLTDESLLIKNDYLLGKIKEKNGKFLDTLLVDAPDDLASIFFRFKPLFLAMKSISRNKTFFNRLRKKATKLHRPMPEDYLNSITKQIKRDTLSLSTLQQKLEKTSIFRKIRLAYALEFRDNPGGSIIYQVRNGRGWTTEFDWPASLDTRPAQEIVLASIANDIRKNVEGFSIYIPPNVHYALPATEKQFTGHFPTGSYVSISEDMIVGIHWADTDKRVDLDLSLVDKYGKTGWDAGYRTSNILFSGDVTAAPLPNGATELFYLKETIQNPKIMMVNFYNFREGDEVETKIIVAHEKARNFSRNYMVDASNIIAFANVNITRRQNILGLIANINGGIRFYFANVTIGNSITAGTGEQSRRAREYLVNRFTNSLDLREVLEMAGATITDEKPDGEYLDLSPEALNKTTIVDLLKG